MAFLLAVSTGLVLIVGRGLLLGVLDVGRFLLVGLAFAAILLSVASLFTIMANNIPIVVFSFIIAVAAPLVLLLAITFCLLELRLHLLVSFAALEAMSVGLVDRTAPLFTAGIAVGAALGELLEAGAAVGVELRVLLIALLQEHVALFPIREGSIAGEVMLID